MDGLTDCRLAGLREGWPTGVSDYRTNQKKDAIISVPVSKTIPYYYNGYNDSTVANVYTHYNETTCYTLSTKST